MSAPEETPLTPDDIRAAMRAMPTSVVLVAAQVDGGPAGMLASSFTSVSLDPPLVSVAFMRTSSTWPRLRRAPLWGVSLLSSGSGAALARLSRPAAVRFEGVELEARAGGALVLPGASLTLTATPEARTEAGDHVLELLQVRTIEADAALAPLVLHDRTPHSLVAHTS